MSVGQEKYELRRQVELIEERRRLRRAQLDEAGDDLMFAIAAFFKGDASLSIEPGNVGFIVRFIPPQEKP